MAVDAQVTSLQQENAALAASLEALGADCGSLRQQLDWFRRQLFGRHSEKRLTVDLAEQANLFESLGVEASPAAGEAASEETACRRRKARGEAVRDSGLRFDASVPVTAIEVRDPAVEAIPRPSAWRWARR